MRILYPSTIEEFQEKTLGFLSQKEAENCLMLGVVSNLLRKTTGDRAPHRSLVLEAGGEVVGAALQTPPYPWVVTFLPEEVLPVLADEMVAKFPGIPGVMGPRSTVFPLARELAVRLGKKEVLQTAMGLYQVEEVEPVPPASGRMRPAEPSDLDLLVRWSREFHQEVQAEEVTDEKAFIEGHLGEQRILVWDDGKPVAMAIYGGETPTGVRIYMVYTPVPLRRLGYASNLTASLSQKLLDSGRKACFLFTDMTNPTSNHIYQRMGYRMVGDWDVYHLK